MIEKWFNKVSYIARRNRQLSEFENKFLRYFKMDDVEFVMDYTKAITRYLENQITFGFSWVSTMIAVIAAIYGHVVSVKHGIGSANFSEQEIELILRGSIVIGLLILVAAILFLAALSRQRYKIIQEKVFMEEMKELRIDRENWRRTLVRR